VTIDRVTIDHVTIDHVNVVVLQMVSWLEVFGAVRI
jgi:hypothetical protein